MSSYNNAYEGFKRKDDIEFYSCTQQGKLSATKKPEKGSVDHAYV